MAEAIVSVLAHRGPGVTLDRTDQIEIRRLFRGVTLPQPELVAMGVAAQREPARSRYSHLLVDLTAEFGNADDAAVDVIDCKYGRMPRLSGSKLETAEPMSIDTGQQVLCLRNGELVGLPAEQTASEGLS